MDRIKNRKFWQIVLVIMRDGNSTSDLSWLDSIKKLRKGRLGGNICLLEKELYITFFFYYGKIDNFSYCYDGKKRLKKNSGQTVKVIIFKEFFLFFDSVIS